ncbi:E3 SUMO-protein ligase RanBP2, partial [Anoplophora glabripennis]|uniref:E3 SUMO-protein ligase RanBP2 n=1 Tax=Anoplophora glabripennis TaxID=217634 RepID=UPI000C77C710
MFKTKLEVDRHVDNSLKKINNETERNLRCFSFAKLYFNVGDYEQTCRYVSSYLTVKPKSPEGYQLLGKALEKLSKKEAALEAYRTSLQLDPKQNNLVIKVCELLASDDVDMDQSGARYFCDLAQSFDPHNPAVFSLRERLITTENENPIEVSKLLLKELETRPTDVNLWVRLLKHLLQNNLIKEAYEHASTIEEQYLSIFHNDLTWYETFAEVLVRFESDLTYSSQLTWEFWFLFVSVQDRLVALSLDEHLDTVKTSTEYVTAVFNFDQMLSKASQNIQTCPDRQLVTVFLSHYHAQLYFYLATLIFKQAKKDLIQFKEASNVTLPVLLAAYHSSPPDLQSMWLIQSPENRRRLVQHWHKEASYRCSQTGHILLAAAKDRKTIVLEKATQYSTGMWREQLYKKVFVKRDQQLKISTSFFVSSFQVLEPVIKLPDPLDLVKFDEVAQLVYPDSLHHYIWLGLNSKLSDMEVKSFEGLQYSIKNLNNCAAEALNVLDIQSFLYCAILCAKSKMEDTKNLIYYNHDRPTVLSACVTDHLGTLNQSKFISAAYKMYKNEQGANMGEVRLLLIKAIEVVRCIGHHGLDVRLLVALAKIFEERSKKLAKQSEIEFNDARAEMYWKTALPFLEKVKNNQMITYSNNRLFEYKGKDISISEASSYIESGKLFTAIQLMKKKEYEKALHIFEQLKDPYASFYQSEIYKHMADQKTNQNKENVTSEMRSQNIILLSRARDCLYLTLDRLREPSVDRTHPLNSQLGTEIEKIERLLSRIDPDCTNRNECDGMSDENPSSDNSAGDHYLTTYTTHTSFQNGPPYTPKHDNHNHSTPMRYNISRQEARPSPERLDAQIRQMTATRDSTLTSILEQIKIMVESHRSLLDELRSFKDTTVDDLRSVKKGFEELKDVKKSVEDLKSSVDELQQNLLDVVQDMKKEINELKTHTKNNQLSDEDLYVLDPDYGVDYNINSNIGAYNTNLPSVYPNYQPGRIGNASNLAAAYAPPGLYPGLYPGLTYAYGGLGLPQPGALPFVPDQQLPSISASVAASYAQPILGQPSLTQGLPSTSLGIGMLTGQILSHTVPHITQPIKESSKAVPASTTQSLFSSSPSSSATATINKAAPVNVVITNSDPLPTTRALTSQPVLSVTIPPQHIKSNIAKSQPHNYQIPLPSTAVTAIASTPSVLSKPPPAISTQSLLSNVSPPVFSAVAQTKSPSKNVSLGLQIEKTLDKTFSPDKNNSTLNRSNVSTNSVEEHDPCPDFKPIVPLPDEVPVNTGEECETELFCERAKLFRHVNNNGVKEWKERGVGSLKILHNASTAKIRILMRRDQVHKICANHFITKDMLLTPMANNDRAYVWAAHDFADESVVLEKFCVRFKTSEEAKKFHEAFESAKKLIEDPAKKSPQNSAIKQDVKPKKTEPQNKSVAKPAVPATTSLGGFVFTSTPTFKPKEAVAPAKIVEAEQSPKSSPFSSLTFGKVNVTPNTFKSDFKPVQTTEATTFSPLVISQNKPTTPQKEDADDDSHAEDFVPTAEFKPLVALPELVDHKTGEENSEILFECRAKLFRYDTNGEVKEWKERGVGIIKILKDESVRLLMRRDQVLKVCCNHKVLKNMAFKLNTNNPKAVVWHAQDFSEGVLTPETFTVRFKTEEQANQFLQVLQTAQTSLDENNKVSGKHHKPDARPRTTSFGDKFKPAKGSWECKNCYIINEGKTNHCIACESPKPGTTAKKPEESELSGPVFSFGIPTTQASTPPTSEGTKTGGFTFSQKPALDTSKGISLDTPGQKFTFGIPQAATATTEPVKTFAFGTPTTTTAGAATQFSFGAKSSLDATKTSSIFTAPASTSFSFTPAATTTSTKSDSKFVFGSPQKHEFEFKPRSPRRISSGQGDEESDGSYVEEEEDNIYFKPVIPLPEKVDVRTGEEDESVLYCHRAKLFRFVSGEWKERGLGDVKILQRKDNGKLRVVMRREQVLKICLNHHLTKETEYIPKDEKSWLFHAADFSEGEIAHEQFCIRFKNLEVAQDFRKAVTDAVNNAGGGDKGNDFNDNNNNPTGPVKFTNDTNLLVYSSLAVFALALCYIYLK